jgi:hypothetical protein
MFVRLIGRPRGWLQAARAGALAVLPFAIWLDYLRSIYRGRTLAGGAHITTPFSGLASEIPSVWRPLSDWFTAGVRDDWFALVAFLTQAIWIVWRLTRRRKTPAWAVVGAAFLLLALLVHPVVAWVSCLHARRDAAHDGRERAPRPRDARVLVVDRLANLGVVPGVCAAAVVPLVVGLPHAALHDRAGRARRSEHADDAGGPPARGVDHDELDVLARLDAEVRRFPEQRVVDEQLVAARLELDRELVAEHHLDLRPLVQPDDHLALADVRGMRAADRD